MSGFGIGPGWGRGYWGGGLPPVDMSPYPHSRFHNDNNYSVTYNRYIYSRLQRKGETEFLTRDDGIVDTLTRNPNYPDFTTMDPSDLDQQYLSLYNNWTLEEKIDFALNYNVFNLDQELVVVQDPNLDDPINYSNHIYRLFLEHFFEYEINQQTIDLHKIKLQGFFRARKFRLQGLIEALRQRVVNNTFTGNTTGGTNYTDTTNYANASSTVPENEVNIEVSAANNNEMTYADNYNRGETIKDHQINNNSIVKNVSGQEINLWRYLTMDSEFQWLFQEALSEGLFKVIF